MPRRLRAQLETRLRRVQSQGVQPSSEFREMEKPAWRLGSEATRQSRTRPPLCKRCAASVQKRTKVSRSWRRKDGRRYRQLQFLAERSEAQIIFVSENEWRD